MIAWVNKFEKITETRLKETFKLFDKDGNQTLETDELKGALGDLGEEHDWNELVK